MPIVWITGGARRIGRGLAVRFAERGYDVAFTFHTSVDAANETKRDIESLGRRCESVQCDVGDEAALNDALVYFESKLGIADVVVSNAGVFPKQEAVVEMALEGLQETLSVNTFPLLTIAKAYHVACARAALQGRLISIGSLGSMEIWKDRIAYNVSKSALQTLAHTLARALAPSMTVNTVAPGAIAQPEDVTSNDASLIDPSRIPMRRHGSVDDVFDAVWFFATASTYITGQTIVVDGGYRLVR